MMDLEELNTKYTKLEERVSEMDKKLDHNNIVTEISTKTLEKLTDTMEAVQFTMKDISHDIKCNTADTQELKHNMEEVTHKIDSLEDKQKFDIMAWVKGNFIGVAMGIGAIVYAVSQIIG